MEHALCRQVLRIFDQTGLPLQRNSHVFATNGARVDLSMEPVHLLMSSAARDSCGQAMDKLVRNRRLFVTTLPPDGLPALDEKQLSSVNVAFFSRDLHRTPSPGGNESARAFFKAALQAPRLRWTQIFFVGIDDVPVLGRLMAKGVDVTTATGAGSDAIAQSVIAAVLAISRGFLHHISAKNRKHWNPLAVHAEPPPIRGQQVTIVGLGPIGREVSRLLKVFGPRIVGISRSGDKVDFCDCNLRYADLATVLPTTNWLVLACPLTELTRRLIDKTAIDMLPRGARIINVARGAILDEAALIEALRSGHLTAAYLDVFSQEPLPSESPLWTMDNVLISPHTAGARSDYDANVQSIFLENLVRFCDGLPLLNSVNPAMQQSG